MTVKMQIVGGPNELTVVEDPQKVSVKKDVDVEWWSDVYKDWRVIFGPDAPLHPKVASPRIPKLTLKDKRAEDLRHVKYAVVAWSEKGLVHEDPELIVDE